MSLFSRLSLEGRWKQSDPWTGLTLNAPTASRVEAYRLELRIWHVPLAVKLDLSTLSLELMISITTIWTYQVTTTMKIPSKRGIRRRLAGQTKWDWILHHELPECCKHSTSLIFHTRKRDVNKLHTVLPTICLMMTKSEGQWKTKHSDEFKPSRLETQKSREWQIRNPVHEARCNWRLGSFF